MQFAILFAHIGAYLILTMYSEFFNIPILYYSIDNIVSAESRHPTPSEYAKPVPVDQDWNAPIQLIIALLALLAVPLRQQHPYLLRNRILRLLLQLHFPARWGW